MLHIDYVEPFGCLKSRNFEGCEDVGGNELSVAVRLHILIKQIVEDGLLARQWQRVGS